MKLIYVNIHTHRPTSRGIELRTAGIHPLDAGTKAVAAIIPQLAEVQAIGETGLDNRRGAESATQLEAFRAQLELARKYGMPVVIHCVRAFEAVMRELAAKPPREVIFHGFIGSKEQAQQALARGYYLSFGLRSLGSSRTIEALRQMPLDRIFVETDDDDEPIEAIYARVAETIGIDIATLQRTAIENYKRIFANNNG